MGLENPWQKESDKAENERLKSERLKGSLQTMVYLLCSKNRRKEWFKGKLTAQT